MINHKCSYYCQPPIHAVETATHKRITELELQAYFLSKPFVVDVISIKKPEAVNDDFILRATQYDKTGEYDTPWVVILHISDSMNAKIMGK